MRSTVSEETSWRFDEGEEIVPGRHAVRLLGGGRRYEAYLAWDDTLYSLVVVKILRPSLVAEAATRAALARESRALRALDHPAIVRSFAATLDGERPHLVLEFLDGPRLSTLIRRHGVILEQLLPLALEVCSALHYMSTRGIVHLDVKPRNIIMSGPPRLIDLSVATRLDEIEAIKTPIGTDAYMAPEQCDPQRFTEIGAPSDVWGLGVALYEAISRSLPFPPPASDSSLPPARRYPQLLVEPKPLPRDVPEEVAGAVLACLEKSPEDRPSARELAETLEPLVAGLPRPRLGLFRPGGRIRRGTLEIG
jgi:eukaryotic-like serine/threonine-protein kinase